MESLHDKVVKLTAEILKKSWKSEPGKVSPFSSSSSNHTEQNDNHLEYYVQKDPKSTLEGAIASIFNSNFWTNGGEKMTEKTLDVDSSTTQEQQYDNPGSQTTEPDAQSEIAITKSLEGEGTYSTTANTTEQAPEAGETTEPVAKAEACPHCGQSMPIKKSEESDEEEKVEKAADEPESKEEEAKETPQDEKKEEMKKSFWGGSLSPQIKRGI
jgi:hypothetical protein